MVEAATPRVPRLKPVEEYVSGSKDLVKHIPVLAVKRTKRYTNIKIHKHKNTQT